MMTKTQIAFAHPIERAASMQDPDRPAPDRISVRDHTVEVEIGAFQSERGTTQRVRFNIVVEVKPHDAAQNDDVDQILSYDKITDAIAFELAAERLNLLETLAERIADRILIEPQALRTFVRIEKLDRGPGALGVEIVRDRVIDEAAVDVEDTPQPRVLFLSNAALHSDNLTVWLDQLSQTDVPLLICVGASDQVAPQSDISLAQRRIDLLAIEQNAWVLAGRDARCVVVNTRTEIDYALRHAQICVWAPSKIVLDSVETPSVGPKDAVALAQWFAEELDAVEMMVVGEDTPINGKVPVVARAATAKTL